MTFVSASRPEEMEWFRASGKGRVQAGFVAVSAVVRTYHSGHLSGEMCGWSYGKGSESAE